MTGVPASVLPDLLRALTVLRPADAADAAAIARLFGIEAAQPVPSSRKKNERQPPPEPPIPPSLSKVSGETTEPSSSASSGVAAIPNREVPAVLAPDYTEGRRAPDWLITVEPFPASSTTGAAPVREPLLEPLWARGILAASVATLSEAGSLDLERLVRGVACGMIWRRVPRQPSPTLSRGAVILVDRSDTLLPFAADQEQIVEQIRGVVGRDRLKVLSFEGSPSWGAGNGSPWEWEKDFERWRPPPGTPVLALTDLAIGKRSFGSRPVHPLEWRDFAERLRRSGCPLVAFVPYAPERWPAGLERVLHILPWDRGTSVRTVRRALGKALNVPGGDWP